MRRNEIDAGSQPVRNLITNPAFETIGNRDMTLRTNHFYNPFMRAVSSTPSTMRTNLISNASMEASGAPIAIRTNYVANPGAENSTANTSVRTNLVTSPRGVSALSPYNGTGTQTPNVSISGVPEGITTALRVTYTTQSNPGVSFLDVAEAGVTYSMSAWVYHESIMSTPGLQAYAQAGVQSSGGTVPEVGKWVKLSWTWTASGTSTIGFRVSSNSGTGSGSFLITGMLIEKSSVVQPFFDGATTSLNLAKNPSFETDTSLWGNQWYGNGGGAGTFGRVAGIGISGGAAARKTWTTANTTNALDVGISTTIYVIPGQTYTSSIYQRSSFNSYLTCYVIWKDASNAVISTSSRTNFVGTPGGAWVRGYTTEVAPANAVTGVFVFGPYTNSGPIAQGATIDWDWCLIEESDKLNPYYDGTAAAPSEFTYVWNGTANNSTSIQRAPLAATFNPNTSAAKVWQTSVLSHNGTKSVLTESTSATTFNNGFNFGITNLPIGTYVFSAYVYLPAAFGATGVAASSFGSGTAVLRGSSVTTTGSWQRTSVKFTVSTLGTTYLYIITDAANGAAVGAKFYADSFMVEAVPDISPYFDAANPRTNLLTNSNFETNTSGWGGAGSPPGVISRAFSPVFTGSSSLQVVCDGTAASQGAYTSSRITVKPNRYYTASAWVRADSGKTMRLELGEWDSGANIIGSRTSGGNVTGTGEWIRVSATRLMGPNADSVDIVIRNANAVAHTFFVDAVMIEDGDTLNDYYESTGPFTYAWTGTANNSTSEQRATAVNGIVWQGSIPPYQSTTKAFTGTKSLYVEGNASDAVYAVFVGPNVSGLTVGTSYTLSAWVYIVPGSVGLELQPSGVGAVTSGRTVSTGKWERVYQTFAAASSSHTLRLRTTGAGKVQAYVDAMVLEQGVSTNLPFFDGATPAYENLATGVSTTALSGATVTTGVSYSGTVWSRVTAVTGTGAVLGRISLPLVKLVDQQPYAVSVTVANDQATSTTIALDWCDSNSVNVTLAPGEVRRISTSGVRSGNAAYDTVYRFADLQVSQSATEQKSVLFKDWLIERGTTINNYYSGTGDFTYAWTGAADASTSTQRYYITTGQVSSKNNSDINTRFFGYASVDENGVKTAKWLAPAGTPNSGWRVASIQSMDYANIQAGKNYTLYIKYRASGWPTAQTTAVVQLSDGGNNNQVMPPDVPNRLNLQVAGWQTYRRTFTAALTANTGTLVYMSLPATPDTVTDGILEVSEVMLLDNSYSGVYFDGSTVSTDPDISFAWNGTADASTSKMLGTTITGVSNTTTHGHAMASTEWKSSGTTSMRLVAKNNSSNDSFTDIRPMVANGAVLKPYTKYTIAGTRYLKAPLTGTLNTGSPGFRVNAGGDRPITYKPGYTVVNTAGANRVVATFSTIDTGATAFIRLQQGSMEGNGDVWWDDVILVEGDYDGRYLDGTKLNAKWEGTAHASTSVGYPTTVESLIGMPVFYGENPATYALDSSKIGESEPRTFYSIVDAPVDLPSAMVDGFWTYGQTGLSDSPANKTITFRYQSENGSTSNSVLARRTGGAGALKTGVPAPGRYIMFCGLDESGLLFTGHGGNSTLVKDNVAISVPHEQFRIEGNNAYHVHVATYIYKGLHDTATRAEVIKMLAQRHNVPLLV